MHTLASSCMMTLDYVPLETLSDTARPTHDDTQFASTDALSSSTLYVQSGIDLNPHTRHTRILGQHNVRVCTVLQISLVLEHCRVLGSLDTLGRVFFALAGCQLRNRTTM